MSQLTAVIPPGNDKPLDTGVLGVESALKNIGLAYAGNPLGEPSANQIAAFYTSTKRVRTYCQERS